MMCQRVCCTSWALPVLGVPKVCARRLTCPCCVPVCWFCVLCGNRMLDPPVLGMSKVRASACPPARLARVLLCLCCSESWRTQSHMRTPLTHTSVHMHIAHPLARTYTHTHAHARACNAHCAHHFPCSTSTAYTHIRRTHAHGSMQSSSSAQSTTHIQKRTQ